MIANAPVWITPKGFLFTATESIFTAVNITATNTSSYMLLNGVLPPGLTLSTNTGIISGTPDFVSNLTRNRFTIRAQNQIASVDRTFYIDVQGADLPEWNTITITTTTSQTLTTSTTEGYLPLGSNNQPYAINRQYINFQLSANPTQSPISTNIKYFIPNQSTSLPPNLTLTQNGLLTGILDCFTINDLNTLTEEIIYNPKEYQFYIGASNNVIENTRLFKLVVVDPNMIRAWNTLSTTDIEILNISLNTETRDYLQKPQFLIDENLGNIRAENYHIISVQAYDPEPLIGTLTYSLITGTSITTNLPNNLLLDTVNGNIYGYLPYQPSFTKDYQFKVSATKIFNNYSTTTDKTFNLTVKGLIENNISWVSTETLDTIYEGQISDLYIKAEKTNTSESIKYDKKSGTLPNGLTFQSDGTLTGKVAYNTSGTYIFTATAQDVYELNSIQKEFKLTVLPLTAKYTEIYVKPFLSIAQKAKYSEFINNEQIFIPNYIYRYYDTNFGIQKDLRLTLEFDIEQIQLEEFYTVLSTNFYRKRFYFGDLKIAYATDINNKPIYELIYFNVIDDQAFNNKNVSSSFILNSSTYYPASIDNMKYRLRSIQLDESTTILTSINNTPKFFKNLDSNGENTVSYIPFIPICYAIPGEGTKIFNRILFSKFDYKQFFIDTDRLIVKDNLSTTGEKYLFFPNKNIKF